jgi:arsenate reductase
MKTVLFVYAHNSGRSQMAEAFLNDMSDGRASAISAGTQPADRIDPAVVGVMREAGLDISGRSPKGITDEAAARADVVVTMGCGVEDACPATLSIDEDWGLDDPHGQPMDKVRKVRDEVRDRVRDLLDRLG